MNLRYIKSKSNIKRIKDIWDYDQHCIVNLFNISNNELTNLYIRCNKKYNKINNVKTLKEAKQTLSYIKNELKYRKNKYE